MKQLPLITVGLGFMLASCGQPASDNAQTAEMPENVMPTGPSATGPGTALGLTTAQLMDADLKDTMGVDLGDIEGVVADADGNVAALRVEIDDTDLDQIVAIPLDGLTAVQDGGDWDVIADTTHADLLAMPEVPMDDSAT